MFCRGFKPLIIAVCCKKLAYCTQHKCGVGDGVPLHDSRNVKAFHWEISDSSREFQLHSREVSADINMLQRISWSLQMNERGDVRMPFMRISGLF